MTAKQPQKRKGSEAEPLTEDMSPLSRKQRLEAFRQQQREAIDTFLRALFTEQLPELPTMFPARETWLKARISGQRDEHMVTMAHNFFPGVIEKDGEPQEVMVFYIGAVAGIEDFNSGWQFGLLADGTFVATIMRPAPGIMQLHELHDDNVIRELLPYAIFDPDDVVEMKKLFQHIDSLPDVELPDLQ